MAVTRWRVAYDLSPREWSGRNAESIRKEYERIYQILSQIATDLESLTVEVEADAGGDVQGPDSSVDGEIALFDGITGKRIKAATGTGVVSATDGVYSVSTLTALLDALLGSAQGTIAYRGAASWAGLAPGTSGRFLQTQGAGANPAWADGGSGGGAVYTPLTDGDETQPELVFDSNGDCIMVELP